MSICNIHKNKLKKIFPDSDINDLTYDKLNGFTNETYKVTNNKTNTSVILRIYTDLTPPVNIAIIKQCSDSGFGAKLLEYYKEGRIESWIDGRPLKQEDLKGNIIKEIAKRLREFHNIIGLNHNDLNLKNILLLNSGGIKFIDFEYLGKLDKYYDIANFFLEWMYRYECNDWYNPYIDLLATINEIRLFSEEYFLNNKDTEKHIGKIIDRFDDVNRYWIDWASKRETLEYKLFKCNREILLNKNYIDKLDRHIIYCDGAFDLLHLGHIKFFKKIKEKFKCKKLIVGVLSDNNIKSYKRQPILDCNTRTEMLSNISIVDEVINDCPLNNLTKEFLDTYNINIVVYGGDPNIKDALGKWESHYKVAIDRNILKMVNYTSGYSTTSIINKCKLLKQ